MVNIYGRPSSRQYFIHLLRSKPTRILAKPCFLDNRKCFFFDIETLPLRVKNCGILELRNQWQRIYLQDTLFRQMNLKYISSYKPVRFRQKGRKILL